MDESVPFKPWSHPAVLASACCLLAKTQAKTQDTHVVSTDSVRILEHADSKQTARSIFRAWGTFAASWLRIRSKYDQRACHVRALYCRRAHNALTLRFFFIFASSLALRTTHLTRACCARDKCVVRTYSTLFQFNCATCVRNSREPYWISTCSALTTHVVRTDFCSTKTLSVFFRKFGGSFLH